MLRRRARTGDITTAQAEIALSVALEVIDYRNPHTGPLSELAWTWRDNLSFYDALLRP